jgi:quercetin dioxygenase-like cupin family protein
MTTYHLQDLANSLEAIPADSIVSKTFFTADGFRAILFGFAPGQELSEHTAAKPAVLHILEGDAALTLGADPIEGTSGTWVHMPANLPHSVKANTEVKMVLLLLG